MPKKNKMPPIHEGYYKYVGTKAKLLKLGIGDQAKFPIRIRTSLHAAAKHVGIKIITRGLGSKKTVTVWRVR